MESALRCAMICSVALALLGPAAHARADAIPGPPEDCAPGTLARSSHAGAWCEDTSCQVDADCEARWGLTGSRCRNVSVCVSEPGQAATGTVTFDSERGSFPGPGRETYGLCTPGCQIGACERALRCVDASYIEAPAPDTTRHTTTAPNNAQSAGAGPGARSRGCACSTPAAAPHEGHFFAAVALVGLAMFRCAYRKRR